MLYFLINKKDGNNQICGHTVVGDEVPGSTRQDDYLRWDQVPVDPPFESEEDAQERAFEVEGKGYEGGVLIDIPPPPPEYTGHTSVLSFRNRMTMAEKQAIYTASSSDVVVKMFLDDLAAASYVDVEDPQTIAGIDYLISAGLIEADRRSDILALSILEFYP